MRNLLIRYFGFTKREYNGLLVLMAILLLISVFPHFYARYFIKAAVTTEAENAAIQQLILVDRQRPNYDIKRGHDIDADKGKIKTTLFKFDPNKIEVKEWQRLGLSLKQAQSILNYRNKGGKFYKPEDLKRMYTITPEKYQQLVPYIEIEDKSFDKKYPEKIPYAKKELVIVEINTADTLQLDQIKGIGASFAKRIVKYREKLGGFYRKEQLMEVFGLDSIKFEEIAAQVRVDIASLKKININTAEFDDLKNHPYFKYKQINAIIQYRKQHGKFNSIDDLKKVVILTPQNLQLIIPYLTY